MGTERAAESVELIKRARRPNPLTPAWQLNMLGYSLYFAGQYEQAIQERRSAPGNRGLQGLTYAQLGREAEAAR